MKVCIICFKNQDISEFYVHKQMTDGHINKCKTCCKKQTKEREEKLRLNDEWKEKEKDRHRKKYHRLNYKEKHKPSTEEKRETQKAYIIKYPEKRKASLAAQRLPKDKGIHNHHWSYNEIHYKDCIQLDEKTHNFLHRHITYDQSVFMYRDKGNNLLNTREKHEAYLEYLLKTIPF